MLSTNEKWNTGGRTAKIQKVIIACEECYAQEEKIYCSQDKRKTYCDRKETQSLMLKKALVLHSIIVLWNNAGRTARISKVSIACERFYAKVEKVCCSQDIRTSYCDRKETRSLHSIIVLIRLCIV